MLDESSKIADPTSKDAETLKATCDGAPEAPTISDDRPSPRLSDARPQTSTPKREMRLLQLKVDAEGVAPDVASVSTKALALEMDAIAAPKIETRAVDASAEMRGKTPEMIDVGLPEKIDA